jgi:hypothetical protein
VAGIRDIEDKEVLRRWRAARRVICCTRKLEMIRVSGASHHHSVETVMALEAIKKLQPQTVAVEPQ